MNTLLGNEPGITALTNGNYVVTSPNYFGGTGAATWGNGTTGVAGTISSTNSLVGNVNTMSDHVGESVTALTNGNYVVSSPHWSSEEGAATWGNGSTGITGFVSSTNSLIGHRQSFVNNGDGTGQTITPLSTGNYVVLNPNWSNPAGSSFVGAATWGNGPTGISGAISTANSLVGSNSNDLTNSGVNTLTNGNYVVDSPKWNGGAGAVTWGNGNSGITGAISGGNSLIGSSAGDHVGGDFASAGNTFVIGVTTLSNGNYIVDSPNWTNNTGAVTWCDGAAGRTGSVSSDNSLVGSQSGDEVGAHFDFSTAIGSGGVTQLANGNYVVASVYWNNKTGAVTWGSGTVGVTGAISTANSLIGANQGDAVGGLADSFVNGVTALPNGNYVVVSPNFSGGKGAMTWESGSAETGGIVASANSVVGSTAGDTLGSAFFNVIALSNNNYVVNSPNFNGKLGAFTWANGASGATLDGQPTINAQNSIEGAVVGADALSIPAKGTVPGSFVTVFPKQNGGVVTIGFTDPNQITTALAGAQNVTITPAFLTNSLNTGTNVTVQANDDITLSSPLNAASVGHGGLTLEAGRNVFLNAAVTAATLRKVSASSTTLSATCVLGIDLNGTTPGDGSSGTYAQLVVTGPINLGGAALHVNNSGGFALGQAFTIVSSAAPITTTFAGLDEGATLTAGGQGFKISYQNDQVTLTVVPSTGAGSLRFSAAILSANETDASATITVMRTGGSSGAVSVTVSTSDGTATAGADYTATNQTVSWADGDTAAKSVTIPLLDENAAGENNATVNLAFGNLTGGATIGSQSTATLTIAEDNDVAPPTASPDTFVLGPRGPYSGSGSTSVLANDTSADGQPQNLTATKVADVTHGALTLNPNGSFTYTPNATFQGIDSFSYQVSEGATTGNTVTVTLLSDHASLVDKLYNQVLHRSAEDSGLTFWTGLLGQGQPPDVVATGIFNSTERLKPLVTQFYQQFLGRGTDPGGLAFWVADWQTKGDPRDVVENILASKEFFDDAGDTNTGYITLLYARVLQRPAEPSGLAYWVGLMTNPPTNPPQTRVQIASQFYDTHEKHVDLVDFLFSEYFNGVAPLPSTAPYVADLDLGQTETQVEKAIIDSPEYSNNPPPPAAGTVGRALYPH